MFLPRTHTRNLKAYDKKLVKARAKKEAALLRRLLENKPTYRLDHLVRERCGARRVGHPG